MDALAELKINHFRAINEASIKLNGITVVAGVNGCGKSTIAKLLYYIFHHSNSYERLALEDYMQKYNRYFEALNQISRTGSGINRSWFRAFRYYDLYFPEVLSEQEISKLVKNAKTSIVNELPHLQELSSKNPEVYHRLFLILENTLKLKKNNGKNLQELVQILFDRLDSAQNALHTNENNRPYHLLKDKICNEFEENVSTSVTLKEYNLPLFGNEVKEVPIPHYVKRVAFIDTPMIFGMDIHPDQPDYWRELNELAKEKPQRGYKISLNNFIKKDILHGEAYFETNDPFNNGFMFRDNNGKTYNILNCATGIKTFSILQMLLKNRFLAEDTMMILDESETNLHPQWIVELANLIVEIHKRIGTKFFITSHSTDMVGALRNIGDNKKILSDVSFYQAVKEDHSELYNYNYLDTDIEPIFESFNKSYEKQNQYTERV